MGNKKSKKNKKGSKSKRNHKVKVPNIGLSDDSFLDALFSDAIDEFEPVIEIIDNNDSETSQFDSETVIGSGGIEVFNFLEALKNGEIRNDFECDTAVAFPHTKVIEELKQEDEFQEESKLQELQDYEDDEEEDESYEQDDDDDEEQVEEIIDQSRFNNYPPPPPEFYNPMNFDNYGVPIEASGVFSELFQRLQARRNNYYLIDKTTSTTGTNNNENDQYYGNYETNIDLDEVEPERIRWLSNILYQDPYYFFDYFRISIYD
ncbi:hypothetical protein DFJ63DRAFT_314296 [Scheffersomyces coipomensis]|uniref:uncharacterized protein n=1 Tax=Scheffersomyces coipomensis TaxID=1788519 RepID=UPI00315DC8F6